VWSFRFAKGQQSYWCRWILGNIGRIVGQAVESILSMIRTAIGHGTSRPSTSFADVIGADQTILASELFTHRLVNVFLHSCLVQLLGVVSLLLFPNQHTTSCIAQLLFAFHPTHAEAVANAANRPHILGLLFNLAVADPKFPLVGVAMCHAAALLSAETALFHLPAVMATMCAVRYRELLDERRCGLNDKQQLHASDDESNQDDDKYKEYSILIQTIISLIPRLTILTFTTAIYLTYRLFNSSLSIPSGLIRPAENPFYNKLSSWSFTRRMVNYSYITSLHVMKSLSVEIVGMSHEYGYDCVPEIQVGTVEGVPILDLRLALPLMLVAIALGLSVWCWYGAFPTDATTSRKTDAIQRSHELLMRMLLLLVFFAWLATLFPIAGILKVGTFIADRIAVASTVGTCIFGGRLLAIWVVGQDENFSRPNKAIQVIKATSILLLCTKYLAVKTHQRTAEWMDSFTLLESSLQACPRSIKSNLEMSKLYSGLVPHMVDFKKALNLIETAHKIDPAYCDVHQQYGHVYFQQGRYIPFEEAMVQSLMCPFTMGQAMTNWKKYWNAVLTPRNGVTDTEARKRYDGYMKRIEESIAREAKKAADEDYDRRLSGGGSDDGVYYFEDEL
jgi:hypothetical protein